MFKKLLYKTQNLLCAALICSTCVSCNDWLDVSSRAEVKYDDLFSYKNGFKDQLTGIYTSLCSESLYGANLTYGMLDAMGQQYTWTSEGGKYYNVHRFEYDKSESIINSVWSSMYNSIANINIFIKGIEEHRGVMSPQEEKIYEGEAYALRAMLHFDLLRLFGKSHVSGADEKAIPYVKKISKEVTPLSTVDEVLDFAIKDLLTASELLAEDPMKTGEATTAFLGSRDFHFNYYAARALLARVYLYREDKENALICAREVIGSNKFPWVSANSVTTATAETRDRIFKSECIFTLNNTKLKSLTETYLKESENNSGNLLVTSTSTYEEIFETRTYGFDWRYNYLFDNMASYYVGSNKLWQLSSTYNNRQPLIRVSEMYLIAAECTTDPAERMEYINDLRRHRGFDEGSLLVAGKFPDLLMPSVIKKEYRKEFIGEGQWFFYCKRTDSADLPNVTVPFSKSYYVLPIPDQEKEYGDR